MAAGLGTIVICPAFFTSVHSCGIRSVIPSACHQCYHNYNWRPSLFCCRTASMELQTDGAKAAAIDRLVSSWFENISVSFCIWAPGYGLTLWCALSLLVGGAIQMPQLQLQLGDWKAINPDFDRKCCNPAIRMDADLRGSWPGCSKHRKMLVKPTKIITTSSYTVAPVHARD